MAIEWCDVIIGVVYLRRKKKRKKKMKKKEKKKKNRTKEYRHASEKMKDM